MDRVGGTCLNHGCKPTKALRASAVVAHQARRAAEYGVRTGEVRSTSASPSTGCTGSSDRRVARRLRSRASRASSWCTVTPPCTTDPTGGRHAGRPSAGDGCTPQPGLPQRGRPGPVPPMPGLDSVDALTEVELLAPDRAARAPGDRRRRLPRAASSARCSAASAPRSRSSRAAASAGREDPDVGQIISQIFDRGGHPGAAGPDGEVAPRRRRGGRSTLADGTDRHRQPPADGGGPPLQLRPAGRPRHRDRRARLLRHRRPVPDARCRASGPSATSTAAGRWTHTSYQDGQIMMDPSRSVDGRVTDLRHVHRPAAGPGRDGVAEARQSAAGRAQGRGADVAGQPGACWRARPPA